MSDEMVPPGGHRILVHGGTVLTCDGVTAPQEALVIEGNRILAHGTLEQMKAAAGPGAERIDVDGAAVLPGLVDTHPHAMHFAGMALPLVGGGEPDWNTILSRWGLLQYDTRIAAVLHWIGWAGFAAVTLWLLWRAWQDREGARSGK